MSDSKLRKGFLSEMRRYPDQGWIAGVIAGLSDYFDWHPRLVRLIAVLLAILTAVWPLLIVYGVLWYLLPEGDWNTPRRPSYGVPPPAPSSPPGAGAPSADASAASAPSMQELKARFAKLEDRLRSMEDCVTSSDYELRRELRRLENQGGTS